MSDLIKETKKDAEAKMETPIVQEIGCETVEGSVTRMLCNVCQTPVWGPALPICANYAYVGQ